MKLLELGKAEHLYMFITTAMLIIGVLADSFRRNLCHCVWGALWLDWRLITWLQG